MSSKSESLHEEKEDIFKSRIARIADKMANMHVDVDKEKSQKLGKLST
jgi:hypothetical protein